MSGPARHRWARPGALGWIRAAPNPITSAPTSSTAGATIESEIGRVFKSPVEPARSPDLRSDDRLSQELGNLGVPARISPSSRVGWVVIFAGPTATPADRAACELAVLEAERAQLVAEVEALRGVA